MKVLALLFALACLAAPAAHAQVRLEISGANFRPLPLAAPAPMSQGVAKDAAAQFDDALVRDLTAAGIFQVLDRKGYLADASEGLAQDQIRFQRWLDVGADALLKTSLSMEGGQLRVDARLYSVAASKEDTRITHAVPADKARQLAHHVVDALYRHFTREPGPFQSRLAYVKRNSTEREIWVADWDGHGGVRVADGGLNLLPALSPDGKTVAYTSYRGGRPDLYLQPIGGRATSLVRSGAMTTGVCFSPNGKIAWSQSQGQGAQIWVANANGSNARQVTDTGFFINSSPSWSPDGAKIAFVSDRGGSPQIYVMNADGSGIKRLTFQGNYNQTPDWSPRGDLIAFTARDERNAFDVFTVEVATGKIQRLTQGQGNNEEPTFAPNGRLVMFTSTRDGWPRLYVSTLDGRSQVALPLPRGSYLTPDWGG